MVETKKGPIARHGQIIHSASPSSSSSSLFFPYACLLADDGPTETYPYHIVNCVTFPPPSLPLWFAVLCSCACDSSFLPKCQANRSHTLQPPNRSLTRPDGAKSSQDKPFTGERRTQLPPPTDCLPSSTQAARSFVLRWPTPAGGTFSPATPPLPTSFPARTLVLV